MCFPPHETDDTSEHQQESTDEQTELGGIFADETVDDALRALNDLFDAEQSAEAALDKIAQKTSLGRGGETRANAGASVFAVDGSLELESKNFSEISLDIVKITKRERIN